MLEGQRPQVLNTESKVVSYYDQYSLEFRDRYPSITDRSIITSSAYILDPLPYLEAVEEQFPREMEILSKLGINPATPPYDYSETFPYFNPWGGDKKITHDNFLNIGSHVVAVHLNALMIAEEYLDAGMIDLETYRIIGTRSLLHDACKVYNIYLDKARKQGVVSLEYYISDNAYDPVLEDLKERGMNESLAFKLVYDYGSEAGGSPTALSKFISVTDDFKPVLVPENIDIKCVHAADDMTASVQPRQGEPPTSYILTTEERMCVARADEKASWGWETGMAVDGGGRFTTVDNINNPAEGMTHILSLHGYMAWITTKINEEFCSIFGHNKKGEEANLLVKNLLSSKLAALTPEKYNLKLSGH